MTDHQNTNYFYAIGDEQRGPVSFDTLQALRSSGEIENDTLIWYQGAPEWVHYQTMFPENVSFADMETCSYSGKLVERSKMLQYGDDWISPDVKEEFIQSLLEQPEAGIPKGDFAFPPDLRLRSIFAQSFQIFRSQFFAIAFVTAVIWTPLYLILEYYSYTALDDDSMQSINRYWKLERTMETWIGSIATGAVLSLAAIRWNNGSKLTVGETFSEGMSHYGRLLGTRIVFGFALMGAALIGILPAILVDFLPFQIIWGTLATLAFIYLAVRLAFVEQFAITESAGGAPALKMSWHRTRGRFWLVLGYLTALFTPVLVAVFLSGGILLFPLLDNFVVSAIHSVIISIALMYLTVAMTVMALHLDVNQAGSDLLSP